MAFKTIPKLVIEKAEEIIGTNKLKLIGTEALIGTNTIISDSIESGQLSSENSSFKSCYGCGCEFFYKIDQIKNGYTHRCEVGRGYIEIENDEVYLIRMMPTVHMDEYKNVSDPVGTLMEFPIEPDSHIIVSNYISNNPQEILYEDNCVLTSTAPHIMHPMYMTRNTILGRVGNSKLQPLKMKNLWTIEPFSESVVKSLISYSKQLVLKSTQLDIKKIKTTQILFQPSQKAVEKRGSVYFNEDMGKLQVFDGQVWKTISYEDT